MRLIIDHITKYRYDTPQRRVVQSLRMRPSDSAGQRVLNWSIDAEGGQLGASFKDGAGDQITTLTLTRPTMELVLHITGEVETTDTAGVLKGHRETIHPLVYLRQTDLTAPDEALRELAASIATRAPHGSLALAHALCEATLDAVEYRPGTTHSDYTAAEALAQGAGVCQDHTHILLTLARLAGFPARYVTGYLHSDTSGTAHEASHAWAEIYVDDLGWVGFDASNSICANELYLRVGSGLDAHDTAPVRGTVFGTGQEHLDVTLSVSQGQQ